MIDANMKAEAAGKYFLSGFNCAQSVAAAFADEMGMRAEDVLRLASGFGGGMGGLRRTCGAVTGMFLVLSAVEGYTDSEDLPSKKALYARIREAEKQFSERFGTSECAQLMANNSIYVSQEPSPRTPEYYRTRPCARYVEAAAAFLAELLNKPKD